MDTNEKEQKGGRTNDDLCNEFYWMDLRDGTVMRSNSAIKRVIYSALSFSRKEHSS